MSDSGFEVDGSDSRFDILRDTNLLRQGFEMHNVTKRAL
jgi:hypothetical protein